MKKTYTTHFYFEDGTHDEETFQHEKRLGAIIAFCAAIFMVPEVRLLQLYEDDFLIGELRLKEKDKTNESTQVKSDND